MHDKETVVAGRRQGLGYSERPRLARVGERAGNISGRHGQTAAGSNAAAIGWVVTTVSCGVVSQVCSRACGFAKEGRRPHIDCGRNSNAVAPFQTVHIISVHDEATVVVGRRQGLGHRQGDLRARTDNGKFVRVFVLVVVGDRHCRRVYVRGLRGKLDGKCRAAAGRHFRRWLGRHLEVGRPRTDDAHRHRDGQSGRARVGDGEGPIDRAGIRSDGAKIGAVGGRGKRAAVGNGLAIAQHFDFGEVGLYAVDISVLGRSFEAHPADILAPGVAAEFAGGWINGHATVGRIEVDPAHVGPPSVAGEIAIGGDVDTVDISVLGRSFEAHPADILAPGIPFQVIVEDRHAAVGGGNVDPAGVGAPGPFVRGVNVARGQGHAHGQQG